MKSFIFFTALTMTLLLGMVIYLILCLFHPDWYLFWIPLLIGGIGLGHVFGVMSMRFIDDWSEEKEKKNGKQK